MQTDLKNKIAESVGVKDSYSLEHVLIACQKQYLNYITVDAEGMFWKILIDKEVAGFKLENTDIYWTMGKPLDSQPKEVIEFLNNLLVK